MGRFEAWATCPLAAGVENPSGGGTCGSKRDGVDGCEHLHLFVMLGFIPGIQSTCRIGVAGIGPSE